MLRGLQEESGLDDAREVAVGGELEALLLSPLLDLVEASCELAAPVLAAQAAALVLHQLVEQPHAYVVEELREELDGEGGVDAGASQQVHGLVEHLDHLCHKQSMN